MRTLLLCLAAILGCSGPGDGARALRSSGFSDITMGRFAPLSCGRDDDGWHFIATNPRGERVSGVVCCGIFWKACTVRF